MATFVSIWTDRDTSEGGPTVDEKGATVTVDTAGDALVLHIASDDATTGLWTVALTMSLTETAKLGQQLMDAVHAWTYGADDVAPCPICGSTETVELHDNREGGPEQSITLCAGCGSDE